MLCPSENEFLSSAQPHIQPTAWSWNLTEARTCLCCTDVQTNIAVLRARLARNGQHAVRGSVFDSGCIMPLLRVLGADA